MGHVPGSTPEEGCLARSLFLVTVSPSCLPAGAPCLKGWLAWVNSRIKDILKLIYAKLFSFLWLYPCLPEKENL